MKIPTDKIYKVTKVKVKNDDPRMVQQDFTITGNVLQTEPTMYVASQRGFEEMRTSTVLSVQDLGDGNFMVNTLNSVYTVVEEK